MDKFINNSNVAKISGDLFQFPISLVILHLILSYKDKPLSNIEIRKHFDISLDELDRTIDYLIKIDVILKDGNKYLVSDLGRKVCAEIDEFEKALRLILLPKLNEISVSLDVLFLNLTNEYKTDELLTSTMENNVFEKDIFGSLERELFVVDTNIKDISAYSGINSIVLIDDDGNVIIDPEFSFTEI